MDPALVGVFGTATGAIIVAAIAYLGQRATSRSAAKAAETQAEIDTTKMVMDGWEALVGSLTAELARVRAELERCQEQGAKE